MTREEVLKRLDANKDKLKVFAVAGLAVFGSVARDQARTDSDVDILVEYQPDARVGLFAFVRLQRFLSELLGARVDLVTPAALREEMKDQILREAIRAA
ncbi:MAG: nucleotidyltransferase family protein [Planctomycetes bacterium]|nr:nucleotidyltransferase family protein [Planctomycetota bacterium]